MTLEVTAKNLLLYGAVAALLMGVGASFGWRLIGPGDIITKLAMADTTMAREHVIIFQELNQIRINTDSKVDSLRQDLRPLNIFLCLNDKPANTSMMGLDCSEILNNAKTRR